MGVKFSELHIIPTNDVASDDYYAVLDSSEGMLKRAAIEHSSESPAYGIGTETKFGHLKISNTYTTPVEEPGVAASQVALYNTYNTILDNCLTSWVGTWEEWEELPMEVKNMFTIINITDR